MTHATETTPKNENKPGTNGFVDRRSATRNGSAPGVERRQFTNSYEELTPEARELALAIDEYKATNHRRFITYEEMLTVITSLGYSK